MYPEGKHDRRLPNPAGGHVEDYRQAFLALTVQKCQLHGVWASEFS